jgi:4-alpha-glucanotransferase
MQFGFDPDDPRGPHRLENHEESSVVYTGTHDNDTLRGWWESLPAGRRDAAVAQIAASGVVDGEPWWSIIRLAYSSPARLAMVQAQDVLGLGSEARMNIPGRATGSWRWQMTAGALTTEHAKRLRAVAEESGRCMHRSTRTPTTPMSTR